MLPKSVLDIPPRGCDLGADCFYTGPLLAPLRCVPGLRGLGRGSGVAPGSVGGGGSSGLPGTPHSPGRLAPPVTRVRGDQGGLWGCHVVVTGRGGTSRLCPAWFVLLTRPLPRRTSAGRYPPVPADTCAQPDALDPVCLAPKCLDSSEALRFLAVSRRWDWGASAVHLPGCRPFCRSCEVGRPWGPFLPLPQLLGPASRASVGLGLPAGAQCPLAQVDVAPAVPSAPRPHLGSPSGLAEAHL